MAKLAYEGPNAQQIQYWNEQSGPKWVALQAVLDEQIAPLGRRAMDAGKIAAGERVLDVGCGCGQTSLELGRRVGPSGSVTGVDISTVMLDRAREVARQSGVTNVTFEEADAQSHPFETGAYDAVFSRFGVMFFADSVAAFTNLARAIKPGGRLAFVTWRALAENPWVVVPMGAALQHLPPPPIPEPDAPGPFRFADAEKVRGILTAAGLTDTRIDAHDDILTIGGSESTVERAVDFLLQIGPAAALLREASPDTVQLVIGAVRDALRPFHTPKGLQMPAACWLVTARRP